MLKRHITRRDIGLHFLSLQDLEYFISTRVHPDATNCKMQKVCVNCCKLQSYDVVM